MSTLIIFSGCSNTGNIVAKDINDNLKQEDNKIKIGVITPLSGDYSLLGEDVINSLNLRNDLDNYEIIYEDDKSCDSKAAVNAGNKLIYNDNIDILITTCSNSVQGLYDLTKSENIIHIQLTEGLIYENDHLYQIMPFSFDLYEDLGKFAGNKYNSICIISEQNDVYLEDIEYFKKGLKSESQIVSENIVTPNTKDFKLELLKCREKGSIAVFPLLFPESKTILLKQLNELAYDMKIIAEANDEFGLDKYGKYLEGAEFISFNMKGSQDFRDEFQKKYNREPQFTAIFAYDAIDLIDKFENRKNNFKYRGIFGEYEFDENGNSHAKTYIVRIENSSVRVVREFE